MHIFRIIPCTVLNSSPNQLTHWFPNCYPIYVNIICQINVVDSVGMATAVETLWNINEPTLPAPQCKLSTCIRLCVLYVGVLSGPSGDRWHRTTCQCTLTYCRMQNVYLLRLPQTGTMILFKCNATNTRFVLPRLYLVLNQCQASPRLEYN